MRSSIYRRLWVIAGLTAAVTLFAPPSYAGAAEATGVFSGQTAFGQVSVEPAFDDATGNVVFLLTPNGAPLPSKANSHAQDTLYIPVYPTNSTISPSHLQCQTGEATNSGNCNHLQVLPFFDPHYDRNADDENGSSRACQDYNGGKPCTVYLGHDHLIGVPKTGGAFNVAWAVKLVIFTPTGIGDGAINKRITTLSDLDSLIVNKDVAIAPTPIVFNCSIVSQTVYERGAPLTFSFP